MRKNKAFTILELLVVVAIIAILAVIAIPNFIGKIDQAKASRELTEINAVTKAVSNYYVDHGVYPTLQGKDGTLLQPQPIFGSPHNVDFSSLVPDYLATLPHFSYWWVDYEGNIYHTQEALGSVLSGVFTPTAGYAYEVHKTNGTVLTVSSTYVLLAGEYILGTDDLGVALPEINSSFKNTKAHPESGELSVTGVSLNKSSTTILTGGTETLAVTLYPSGASNSTVTWSTSNASTAAVNSSGVVTAVASGTATITATTVDGSYTASCVVTVSVPFSTQTFNYAGIIQTYTFANAGTYKIQVYGASAGNVANASGGKGAVLSGNFTITQGQQIKVLVGEKSIDYISANNNSTGGGGGTYVVDFTNNKPLIIAGGGGGAYYITSGETASVFYTTYASSGGGANTGTNTGTAGGNGAGYTGNGQATIYSSASNSFINGGAGGISSAGNVHGGFGGGGGTHYNSGGGGGGGGLIGGTGSGYSGGGKAGISLNTGTSQSSVTANTGNGKVIITYVGP